MILKYLVFLSCVVYALGASNDETRVIGGQNASLNQFPYQVSLRYKGTHSCGGSILDSKTILLAAHCVAGSSSSLMTIRLGHTQLNAQTEEYPVKSFTIHDDYDPFKVINDIAIIKLTQPILLRDGVQSITLPQKDTLPGEDVTLSGWGLTSYPGGKPNDLQFINLKTISLEDCVHAHNSSKQPIMETELCTLTTKGEGACQGDSGGPLVDANGVQVGIVSWGKPCALGYPDVFTRVYSFLTWIKQNRH